MRYFEVMGVVQVPISAEEHLLLGQVDTDGTMANDNLDDRQAEIARKMVNRGILRRFEKDGKMMFVANQDPNLRRI